MRFFIDQCVQESVALMFEKHGHEAIRLRERIAPNSPDTLVAAVSESNDAILVTMNSDFRAIASKYGIGQQRFRRLSLLRFEKCRESKTARRIELALSLIEHEYEFASSQSDARMFVVITDSTIRTHR